MLTASDVDADDQTFIIVNRNLCHKFLNKDINRLVTLCKDKNGFRAKNTAIVP